MRILIVGAGVAGLALAKSLDMGIHEVEVVEKNKSFPEEGYVMGVWNNGLRVLRGLGLEKQVLSKSVPLDSYSLMDKEGKITKLENYETLKKKYSPLRIQISMPDLIHVLQKDLRNVKFDKKIKKIKQYKDRVAVTFDTGFVKEYDLVIGADGVNSQVRSLIFDEGKSKKVRLGWRIWYFWTKRDKNMPSGALEFWSSKEFLGLFPAKNNRVCGYLAVPHRPKKNETKEELERMLISKLKVTKKEFPQLLKKPNLKSIDASDISYIKLKEWDKGRVLLIGDAAHAMEPAGIGASMALEDAFVLADELSKSSGPEYNVAIARYNKRRKERLAYAQEQTRAVWKWAKKKSPSLYKILRYFEGSLPAKKFTKGFEKLLEESI